MGNSLSKREMTVAVCDAAKSHGTASVELLQDAGSHTAP
jgi:hypothetical protein